jgi:maltose alpha-D-glucosyltransferase/alpha-amylase
MGVHVTYGNLDVFKTFVNAVHERSMRVIMDFIPNHSSDQHEWFQQARKDRESPYREYYVWSDDPDKYKDARVIFIDSEKSNWTWDEVAGQYYWHRFFSSQPDLNFDNLKVREEMLNIMRHWLDIGIDGFRCDAVPYLCSYLTSFGERECESESEMSSLPSFFFFFSNSENSRRRRNKL